LILLRRVSQGMMREIERAAPEASRSVLEAVPSVAEATGPIHREQVMRERQEPSTYLRESHLQNRPTPLQE
jgi:hypothetical protein